MHIPLVGVNRVREYAEQYLGEPGEFLLIAQWALRQVSGSEQETAEELAKEVRLALKRIENAPEQT